MPLPPARAQLLNGRPFTVSRARELGVSLTVLRGASFRRVCREVYVAADSPDTPRLRLAAAALILPADAVVSGPTAAWLHGLDIGRDADAPLEVTFPSGQVRQGRGLFVARQSSLTVDDVVQKRGVRVTSPERTAYDLARRLDLVEAVVALDAFWHRELVTPVMLLDYLAAHGGLRGVSQVPRVADLADPGADSPMETRLRMFVVLDLKLPRPETQLVVRDANGRIIAVLDLGWRRLRLGLDYDGQVHAAPAVRARDLRRHNRLLSQQWFDLRYSSDAFFHRRDEVGREISETYAARLLLADRNDLGLPGLPRLG